MSDEAQFSRSKLLRFPERLAQWRATGWTDGPIVLDVDVTNRCPHNCPRCAGGRKPADAELTADEVRSYLVEAASLGTRSVILSGGGEPLLHPEFDHIVTMPSALGMSCGLVTNGTNLARHAELISRACTWVRVSLDAASPCRFAEIHGVDKSVHGEVLDGIRVLVSARGGGTANIGVGVLTDVRALSEIPATAMLAKSLGVDFVQYRPFREDFTDATDCIREAATQHSDASFRVLADWYRYELTGRRWCKTYGVCHAHHFAAVITAAADMVVCCDRRDRDAIIGSCRDGGLRGVWNGDRRRRVAARLDLSLCPPICRHNHHNLLLHELDRAIAHEEFL
jgi:pyruvate-formate lyase-activating enzyme